MNMTEPYAHIASEIDGIEHQIKIAQRDIDHSKVRLEVLEKCRDCMKHALRKQIEEDADAQ